MSIVDQATRVVLDAARVTTGAVGAVGGGVVGGVNGGIRGAASGIRDGMRGGARSTPTAVLTLAAVGAVGLVEWPVLVTVGGTAVVLRELDRRDRGGAKSVNRKSVTGEGADGQGSAVDRPAELPADVAESREHKSHHGKSEKHSARTSHGSKNHHRSAS